MHPGDTLRRIAARELASPQRWRELAEANHLRPPYRLLIGQRLRVPRAGAPRTAHRHGRAPAITGRTPPSAVAETSNAQGTSKDEGAAWTVGRSFLFGVVDEVLPSGKIVRKVLMFPPRTQAEAIAAKPEVYGIKPNAPGSSASLGEHALGNTQSRYISGSTKPRGAPNIQGRPVYIDAAKAQKAGVTIHSTEEVVRDLDRLVAENPQLADRVARLKKAITEVEGEVLLAGEVPASAIKSAGAMTATRVLRGVQIIGVVFTVVDLTKATVKSVEHQSAKPIVAESIRQVGGWGGGILGAKIGGAAGAAVGIETGPGAVVTGFVGAVIFGVAGYLGADWVADFIDKN